MMLKLLFQMGNGFCSLSPGQVCKKFQELLTLILFCGPGIQIVIYRGSLGFRGIRRVERSNGVYPQFQTVGSNQCIEKAVNRRKFQFRHHLNHLLQQFAKLSGILYRQLQVIP